MSTLPDIGVVCDIRHAVGESPLWDHDAGCLWWVDALGREVRRRDMGSGDLSTFTMPLSPSALALAEDGALVVAAGAEWYRLDERTGEVSRMASLDDARPDIRMNDGVVDGAGRFWVGTMSTSADRPPVGRLYCLDGDRVTASVDGLRTQNGAAVSPDGKTFYLSDSHPSIATIWAFDFDEDAGALSNRRVFHRCETGRPDGAAVDAEGCYWFAAIDAGQIVRLDPQGQIVRRIDLPVSRPTKPAFGGVDMSTLYITTMSFGLDEGTLAAEPLSGAVLSLDAGVRGWPQPRVTRMPARPVRLDA